MNAPHGMDAEQDGFGVSGESLDLVTFYSANLAVPTRALVDDQEVLHGKELFYTANCTTCPCPNSSPIAWTTGPNRASSSFGPIRTSCSTIWDPVWRQTARRAASGVEWRTAPLWGLGLTEQISGHRQYLRDGRARPLTEAILWHGGEAQGRRDTFAAMPAPDRAALVAFLESL